MTYNMLKSLTIVISILAIVVTIFSPIPVDGILGGKKISIENASYVVAILMFTDNGTSTLRCGGTIISENEVVTAGHCVERLDKELLFIRAGSSKYNSNGEEINISKICIHSDYSKNDYVIENDIAILKLETNLAFGKSIDRVKLPDGNQTWSVGTSVRIFGWGAIDNTKLEPTVDLHSVDLELIDVKKCKDITDKYDDDVMLCAGDNEGFKDACQFDSGGPLIINTSNVLAGITSFGEYNNCGPGGIYTRIPKFINFITSNQNRTCKNETKENNKENKSESNKHSFFTFDTKKISKFIMNFISSLFSQNEEKEYNKDSKKHEEL